jgi:hypothetical protein
MASPLNGTIYPRKKKVDGWIKSKDPRGFRESARFFFVTEEQTNELPFTAPTQGKERFSVHL